MTRLESSAAPGPEKRREAEALDGRGPHANENQQDCDGAREPGLRGDDLLR